ncbi:TonB-dependent receptor [Fulvivirga sedimenti]|uniref:TonB-dependent receptor n=1 Tax=Fulvivirga sedimenti TaxID=2879465 RepID=A0A9X1KUK4_9BACT|nr:TonB-dependent receptor [Fulvivirga sedimenti]MCA6073608.1 TonB-dependent receptor [Fulvivirga sedimenti]
MTRLFTAVLLIFGLAGFHEGSAQQKFALNGYITDQSNGEALIGATIFVRGTQNGTATNVYGFYSLTLPVGEYEVEFSYIGYESQVMPVSLGNDLRLDVELVQQGKTLEEVVITDEPLDVNVSSVEMSTEKLEIQTIKKIPAFLGEVDVLKSLQLLPGVSSVGEGSAGFNVRGGSVGQNLVLLDEAPVYNSSHLFGFFSVFNPDAVKDVKLYKGSLPANYGGRLASILDVRMREGNAKELEVSGGVGLPVFSRLAIQGPIAKDKASFIVAGRRSYVDLFAKPFTDGATLYFYDLTTKVNYNIDSRNRIFLSGYFGRDVFKFDENQGFNWGNITTTFRWNHIFNSRLFSNVTAFISNFDYGFSFGESNQDKFDWDSSIITYSFKPSFTYFINPRNEINFGGDLNYYDFNPARAIGVSDGVTQDISLNDKFSLEGALYVDNTQELGSNLTLRYGLRYSFFHYLGPGTVYEFLPSTPGDRRPPNTEEIYEAGDGELIQAYQNLEPRASVRYRFGKSSIKASYARTAQYIHLISNTAAPTPIDIWTPSTNNIQPQIGDQFALGYFRNFGEGDDFETSLEVYYRDTKNQVEYVRGAELFINELLEGDIIQGDGRAYGLELSVKKNKGDLNGWISYTLGKTELQVDGINSGEWYPTRFDQTHNLKVFANYDLSERTSLSANFSYTSGTPITAPTSRLTVQGLVIPFNYYNTRNNFRIPASHRLDVSLTWQMKREKKGKARKNEDYLVFSIYNVYGRRNPFSIFFAQENARPIVGQPVESLAYKFSIIGSVVPSVSYNFRF